MEYTSETQLLIDMIMKTKYIFTAVVFGVVLASCTNYFDEHFMDNGHPSVTDIRTGMSYTLTDDDYKQIAVYPENIAKALALDPVDSTGLWELQAVAKEKSFTENATADMYIPALMADKYPYLDNGTNCDVQYTMREGKSYRVAEFYDAQGFELTQADYETIWQKRGVYYITPGSMPNVSGFLAKRLPSARLGQIALITYTYSEDEPDPSEMHDFLPYEVTLSQLLEFPDDDFHKISGFVAKLSAPKIGTFIMEDGDYSIKVYKLKDEAGSGKVLIEKDVKEGDAITITGRYSAEGSEPQIVDGVYVSHSTPSAPARRRALQARKTTQESAIYQLTEEGWTPYQNDQLKVGMALPPKVYEMAGVKSITDPDIILKYLQSAYPYAADKEIYLVAYMGKDGATADEWVVNGTELELTTGYITETMAFELKKDQWVANISTYLQAKFVGEGPGKFTIQHVNLDGLNYVWRYQSLYGMTASAYVQTVNHRVEDWLLSPNIKLKKSVKPQLTFDQAVRYGNTTDNPKWLNVMVTNNFTGDVTTTQWKHLEWQAELPDGSSWRFQSSGIFDLSEFNGQTIVLGFRYNTNIDGIEVPSAPTWEIQNLLLAEPAEEEAPEE